MILFVTLIETYTFLLRRYFPCINVPIYLGPKNLDTFWCTGWAWNCQIIFRFASIHGRACFIRVITKLPNSEQSYKGKVKTHNYINRQISQQPENCENSNDPDLVQAFLNKWWVESDIKAPNLPLSLRFKGSGCHYNSIYNTQIQIRPHHFWTYTSNLTTVVNSVLTFMINGTTSILKS
jgi:hypothetical protein